MKRCLVDLNILLALLVQNHDHHKSARRWFDGLVASEAGLCRMVQLGVIRLLGNAAIMRERALSASVAWDVVAKLLEDERLDLLNEPSGIDSVLPELFRYRVPTIKLVADAYLAAFAISGSYRLLTFDRGFRQYRGLDLQVLED